MPTASASASEVRRPLCHYYGGIPYAPPPVGAHRWRRPRALPACYRYGTAANPLDCTGGGSTGAGKGGAAVCPQNAWDNGEAPEEMRAQFDEDCLQLNVWVPAGEPPEGGAF